MTEVEAPALRFDGPARAERRLALTHGAGAPVDDAFFGTLTAGLAEAGVRVARFEFPYMAKRREDGKRRGPDRAPVLLATWRAAAAELGPGWAIGGKSLGGRIASLVADEVGAAGLVCLGYPFHPPGRPTQLRTEHLAKLRTRALIVQGERDPFGTPDEVAGYALSPAIRIHWMSDGDHSLKPRKKSGRTWEQNLAETVDAVTAFLATL